MCGRYTDTRRDKQFLVRMGVQADFTFTPRYNIAPTQSAWIVARRNDAPPELKQARWGLIPFWAKDIRIGSSMINARSDTIAGKPAFRAAYKSRRCLVLADGFYEWRKAGKAKEPIYFRMNEGRPFAFGGLWEKWKPDGGADIESFCVITVPPNEVCGATHDRIPLIVPEEKFASWLDPRSDPEAVNELLRPYRADEMEAFPVSTLVNSASNEDSRCVIPLKTLPL